MKIFGVTGWSGSGKTTLIKAVLPLLAARGLRVGTLKHSHHDLTWEAGAEMAASPVCETVVASSRRFLLVHDNRDGAAPSLMALAARMDDIDLVLVEGFKYSRHPRVEVWNAALRKPLLALADPSILAIVAREPVEIPQRFENQVFLCGAWGAVADFIQVNAVSLAEFMR